MFKAHILLYHSTLGFKKKGGDGGPCENVPLSRGRLGGRPLCGRARAQPQPAHQKSTCLTQLTLGPDVVQIWSRYPSNLEGTKPSYSTVWSVAAPVRSLSLRIENLY